MEIRTVSIPVATIAAPVTTTTVTTAATTTTTVRHTRTLATWKTNETPTAAATHSHSSAIWTTMDTPDPPPPVVNPSTTITTPTPTPTHPTATTTPATFPVNAAHPSHPAPHRAPRDRPTQDVKTPCRKRGRDPVGPSLNWRLAPRRMVAIGGEVSFIHRLIPTVTILLMNRVEWERRTTMGVGVMVVLEEEEVVLG